VHLVGDATFPDQPAVEALLTRPAVWAVGGGSMSPTAPVSG